MIPVLTLLNNASNVIYFAQSAGSVAQRLPDLIDWVAGHRTGSGRSTVTGAAVVEALNAAKPDARNPWDRVSLFLFMSVFIEISEDTNGIQTTRYLRPPDQIVAMILEGYNVPADGREPLERLLYTEIERTADSLAAIPPRLKEATSASLAATKSDPLRPPWFIPLGPLAMLGVNLATRGMQKVSEARLRHNLRALVTDVAAILLDAGLSTSEARNALLEQDVDPVLVDQALQ